MESSPASFRELGDLCYGRDGERSDAARLSEDESRQRWNVIAHCLVDSDLRQRTFGDVSVEATSDLVLGRSSTGELLVVSSVHIVPGVLEGLASSVRAYWVETDADQYMVHRWGGGDWTRVVAQYSADELDLEVAFTGSLWSSIFPEHHALVTRSRGFVIPQDLPAAIFRDVRHSSVEAGALDRLHGLAVPGTRLVGLHQLATDLANADSGPTLLTTHDAGRRRLRIYDPGRSPIFDFGSCTAAPSRDDFVTSYLDNGEEFEREFLIDAGVDNLESGLLRRAAFDLLHMLAIRRTKLFRLEFATRVFTVMLPPGLLCPTTTTDASLAVFPCVTLYRSRSRSHYRRTVSLTTIVVPVGVSSEGDGERILSRRTSLGELRAIARQLKQPAAATRDRMATYRIGGPLKRYVGGSAADEKSLPAVGDLIAETLLRSILIEGKRRKRSADDGSIKGVVFSSSMESQLGCLMVHVDWHPAAPYRQPWERWLERGDDKTLQRSLFRTLCYEDYLEPHSGYASEFAFDLKQLNIGNTLGADMTGMTLYDPRQELKFIIYPSSLEQYPNYSVVRWMAWSIFVDAALAALPSMIGRFYADLGERGDLQQVIGKLDNMIEDFVEFYDLDIREYVYRREYELLRSLMRVDADYQILLDKFESVKEDASLREQRLINKLLVALTVATLTSAGVATIAQLDSWGASRLVRMMGLVTIAASVSSYLVFDPIRRLFGRVRR